MDFLRQFPGSDHDPIDHDAATKIGATTTTDPAAVKGPSAKIAYGGGIGAGVIVGYLVGGPLGAAVGAGLGAGGGFLLRRNAVDLQPYSTPGTGKDLTPTGTWTLPGAAYLDKKGRMWAIDPLYPMEADAVKGSVRFKRNDGAMLIGPAATSAAGYQAWADKMDAS